MSVRHSNENLVSLGDDDSVTCTLCNGVVFELDLMETACKHCFHKACLQNWLQDNNTCPTCSQPCSQSQTVSNQNSGMQNRMMTRSRSRNADNQNNIIVSQNGNSNPHQDNRQTNDSDVSEDPDQQSLANQMRAFQKSMLDNQKTFQVTTTDTITEKMTQMFSQLNRSTFVDNNTQHEFRNNSGQVGFQNNQGQNSQRVGNSPDVRSNRSDLSLDRPDRISNVISNWRIKFSGSADDIAVEDFIYRVNCLTTQSLNGNFDLLSQFANLLFAGPALSFYWRVHRSVDDMNWLVLCRRLKERYSDQRSDREIKSATRRRKQGSNESFDDFLDAMLIIANSLREPMHDRELASEVRHNLKPDLKLELLHVDTPSLEALRKACHRHEEFYRGTKF
nr:uncharacterized protein LOC118879741 [Drosophila suzukii]XP_036678548.1 uncharacterized protein LOC118879741 [Drosophila suzukii]